MARNSRRMSSWFRPFSGRRAKVSSPAAAASVVAPDNGMPLFLSNGMYHRVQPLVNRPHQSVEFQKFAELFIVHPAMPLLRLKGLGHLHDLRDLLYADFAQRTESRQGRPHRVGAARIGDAPHRAAQNVRLDLAPDVRGRPAADE